MTQITPDELAALTAAADEAGAAKEEAWVALKELELQHAKAQADVWHRIAEQRVRVEASRQIGLTKLWPSDQDGKDRASYFIEHYNLMVALSSLEREQRKLEATFTLAFDEEQVRLDRLHSAFTDASHAIWCAKADADDDEVQPEPEPVKKW